jgi:bifunctional UDP-N-acetylglucosamine pyrophosphorylase / glucosamine-1-phosphate N-acetyltransferase
VRTGALPVVVIAAAGRARRFAGEQKVVAEVGGRPAICRVAEVCQEALGPHRQLVVVGHQGERVRAALGEAPHRRYVTQEPLLGTGHALREALTHLEAAPERHVYFLCGDKPLLSARSLRRVGEDLVASGAAMAFLVGRAEGEVRESRQGRVLQAHPDTPRAEVLAIIERPTIDALNGGTMRFEALAGGVHAFTREQLLTTPEVNLSTYVWRESALREHLAKLELHPEKNEYYVTDLVSVLREQRLLVRAVATRVAGEGIGIDTPELLLTAERTWQRARFALPVESPPFWADLEAAGPEATDAVH